MGKKNSPPPPEILRKGGPQKDRSKYDRKRLREEDHDDRQSGDNGRKPKT